MILPVSGVISERVPLIINEEIAPVSVKVIVILLPVSNSVSIVFRYKMDKDTSLEKSKKLVHLKQLKKWELDGTKWNFFDSENWLYCKL